MEGEYTANIKDIENRLHQLFKRRLGVEIKNQNDLLFGNNIRLSARDLVYICFDIEKEFGIEINDDCIEYYQFTTFINIRDFIASKSKEVGKCTA